MDARRECKFPRTQIALAPGPPWNGASLIQAVTLVNETIP